MTEYRILCGNCGYGDIQSEKHHGMDSCGCTKPLILESEPDSCPECRSNRIRISKE